MAVIRTPSDDRFLADPVLRAKVTDSAAVGDLDVTAYDIVYLAGGWGAAYDFGYSGPLADAITRADAAGMIIGGVCHGPLGLINEAIWRYLPDPQEWDLKPAGPVHAPEGLICARTGRERLLLVEDPARPRLSLARAALHLVTGWKLNEPPAQIAARALRARLESAGVASTADLVRPLVTESIQHLGRQSAHAWTAAEFRSPV